MLSDHSLVLIPVSYATKSALVVKLLIFVYHARVRIQLQTVYKAANVMQDIMERVLLKIVIRAQPAILNAKLAQNKIFVNPVFLIIHTLM
jgi:hypothetical protein